jgi:ubiquinone/menaquinone biosynthesis C-methylase UbiE
MKPDFGATAEDYRKYRAGFPESLFDRLGPMGIGRPGQELVDLGTGTGSLARGFARRGCRVIGIDPDSRLLAQARKLDAEAGVEVDYRIGRAEETSLASGSVDVVAAGQCWHWFDRAAAASEASRILRRTGAILPAPELEEARCDWSI